MNNIILNILSKALGSTHTKLRKQNEYMFWSPFITHYKPKLQVNIKNQKWHCWVSNQGGHNFYQLFKAVGVSENSWSDLKEYLNEQEDYYYDRKSKKDLKKIVSLPKEFKRLNHIHFSTPIEKRCYNFLKERGFSKDTIVRYGIGYCESGLYSNRIIIPSYDKHGRLNYFIARDIYGGGMKYKNPPISKNIIGFELFINWDEPIILCEGVFDAMTVKRNAIPLLGKTIPKKLMMTLLNKKVKDVYIILDSDAQTDALRISKKLASYGIQVRLVSLEDKDPNEVGYDKMTEKIESTKELTFSDVIRSKLKGKKFEKSKTYYKN